MDGQNPHGGIATEASRPGGAGHLSNSYGIEAFAEGVRGGQEARNAPNGQTQYAEILGFHDSVTPIKDFSFDSVEYDRIIGLPNDADGNEGDNITENDVKNFVSDILTGKVTLDSSLIVDSETIDGDICAVKSEPFVKTICDLDAKSEAEEIVGELIVKYDSDQPTCDVCFMKFKSLCMLRRHRSSEHVDSLLQCDKCRHASKNFGELEQHKLLTHAEFTQYDCEICHAQFKHVYHLKTHRLIHNVESLLSCDVCNYKCVDQTAMDAHNSTHARNKAFSCNICEFRCSQKSTLERHKNVHGALMRFSCDVCPFKCRLPSKLRMHILEEHSGEKLYSCEICPFRTKHVISLNRHRIVHTGEKPFECDICHFRCNRASNLGKHKMRHGKNEGKS